MVFGESQSLAIAALTGAGVLKALLSRSTPSSSSSGPAELKFSHMGIFATNPEALGSFYEEVLGFTRTDKGEMPGPGGKLMELVFLSRDPEEHHQIVMVSGRPADLAFNVVNQISLSTTSLGEVKQMYALLKERQDITELLTVTHGNGAALPPPQPTRTPHACRPHTSLTVVLAQRSLCTSRIRRGTASRSSSTRPTTASSPCAPPSTWSSPTSR